MTETSVTSGPSYTSPRLARPRDSAFRGVCSALARTTGTDVVLWRVLAVVLLFFGGLGAVLYVAGMVFIPYEDETRSLGERLLHGPDRTVSSRQAVLLALLVLLVFGWLSDANGVLEALVLAVLAVLWWRGRDTAPRAVQAPDVAAPPVTFAPAPPRPRSPLGRLTASLVVVLLGFLLLLDATGAADVRPEVALASALLVVGLGLVVGSFFGGSPGLVLLAVALSLGLGATAAVRPALDAGVGDRTWHATGPASYRLGVGEATLDLTDLTVPEAGTVGIDARVDVGHLIVLVPDGLRVALDARADVGQLDVLGEVRDGRTPHLTDTLGPEGRPQLRLDLTVRAGQVEVRRG